MHDTAHSSSPECIPAHDHLPARRLILHAVVPMKDLTRAKSRLAGVLSPAERRELALEMLGRVLHTLNECGPKQQESGVRRQEPGGAAYGKAVAAMPLRAAVGPNKRAAITAIWVVSGDVAVLDRAEEHGALPLLDLTGDLNGALEHARAVATEAGAEALLVIPADVPLITAQDVDDLAVALERGADIALAGDQEGSGTNALALRLPGPLPFCFGPNSLALHRAAAARLGLSVSLHASPTLALDVDTAANYRDYRKTVRRTEVCCVE